MIVDAEVSGFIAELVRAANLIKRISYPERARLLERAMRMARDYRYEINLSDAPANDGGKSDIVALWATAAENIRYIPDDYVAGALLDAAESIRACKILMDAKLEILREAEGEA